MRAATATESAATKSAESASVGARPASVESLVAEIKNQLGEEWPARIYGERVLAMRTRSHAVPPAARGAPVEVLHTLLGIELKVGRRRISCPDLATARYLSVFARAGVSKSPCRITSRRFRAWPTSLSQPGSGCCFWRIT